MAVSGKPESSGISKAELDNSRRMIGMQKEIWTLFPDIHNLVLQQQSTIADLWTPQGWNFVFRRHLNDLEIPRVTEFLRRIDQFSGLEMGRDKLQWLGNSKGIFKVGAVHMKLNHPNLQLLKWPWKHIWKAKIPYKVSCFVWLLAKKAVLTREFNEEGNSTLL